MSETLIAEYLAARHAGQPGDATPQELAGGCLYEFQGKRKTPAEQAKAALWLCRRTKVLLTREGNAERAARYAAAEQVLREATG